MSDPTAQYTFLPWYRTGLASAVHATEGDRGVVKLTLTAKVGGAELQKDREVHLIGPGDVLGVDPRAIVRIDPGPGANDFEPNYLAAIEFFDEDYVWRYSPGAPGGPGGARVSPWIALIVLEPHEFVPAPNAEDLPRAIVVKDAAVLPRGGELWAWAHAHINVIPVSSADPVAAAGALAREPALGCSRLVAPRRLKPNRAYHAFVVPTFARGRAAGIAGDNGPAGFAWPASGPIKLPVYYSWTFGTGEKGDFEELVRRLRPHVPDPTVGRQPMDVADPMPGLDVPAVLDTDDPQQPILQLEGALQIPGAVPSGWDAASRQAFQTWLASFINLGNAWEVSIAAATQALALEGDPALPNGIKLPIILPPSYGRWHANIDTLDATRADQRWLEQVNLDPRNRVAAALGTLVLQRHQEQLMSRAWHQYGELFRANALRQRAQLFREVLTNVEARHYAELTPPDLLAVTGATHARILVTRNEPQTAWSVVQNSALPVAALTPAGRRSLRAGGPVLRRFGREVSGRSGLLSQLAGRRLELAPPLAPPEERLSLARRPATEASAEHPWSGGDWDVWRPRLLAYLDESRALASRFPRLREVVSAIESLIAQGDTQSLVSAERFRPSTFEGVKERSLDWVPALVRGEGTELRGEDRAPSEASERFSSLAWNFRQATLNAAEWLTTPIPLPAEKPALDVNGLTQGVRASLSPAATVVDLVSKIFAVPKSVPLPSYDPLDAIMAHPTFDDPTYEYLRQISEEYLVPNLSRIENNTVTLLEVNWQFVESFLVGVNHEMARELLWRGYPTDSRGSYFRQFWDVSGIPGARGADGRIIESRRDIHPIHGWKRQNALTVLGDNRPIGRAAVKNLVLVVRGDLLRRYPNVEVYARRAEPNDAPRPEPYPNLRRRPGPERRDPEFTAKLGPDTFCYGFALERDEVIGNINSRTDGGWYFVLAERFGEPRFGLDEPPVLIQTFGQTVSNVKDVTWAHLVPNKAAYEALDVVSLANHRLTTPGGAGVQLDATQRARWGGDSQAADMAAILLQVPVRVFYHANDMLTPSQP